MRNTRVKPVLHTPNARFTSHRLLMKTSMNSFAVVVPKLVFFCFNFYIKNNILKEKPSSEIINITLEGYALYITGKRRATALVLFIFRFLVERICL